MLDRGLQWLAPIGLLAVLGVALWVRTPERAREREQPRELDRPTQPERAHRIASRAPANEDPRAAIRARIVDASFGPLSEGRVELHCLGGAYLGAAAIDETGSFEAPSCREGPTCVRLIHPSVEQPRAWELEPGTAVELTVDPAPQLLGTVVDPDGAAVAGAELLVEHHGTRIAVGTDAAGEFALAFPRVRACDRCDPEPGEPHCRTEPRPPNHAIARVLVRALGLAPQAFELELTDEPVELALAPAAPPITGRVLAQDRSPLDRTRVLASNRARPDEQHATEADAEGRFSFEHLAQAEYSLRAIRDERELATLALARPGDTVELRSDLTAPASALTVEIVDADGEPIAGARIDGGPWRAALTDSDGRVEASAVLPGSYTVRVRAADCAPVREAITLEPSTSDWLRRVQLSENCL